ncbi:MAG: HlyD family efflux transporter periplasmic adaptor subunit [Candidatus Omnitrophica bacterium]|nr:HlyD family efflux transporter periplasmic adaptor subunit [Candidatus Omnitrophota bacterium]
MDPLPLIPIPPAQRWREFRFQVLPVLVFVSSLITVIVMWREYVAPPTLVGEVEPVQARVASKQPGTLVELRVTHLQQVKAGDPVARVLIAEPKVLATRLAVIQAEVGLIRSGMSPVVDQQRNALDYEQLRLNWLKERVDLATARVNLQLAEAELKRMAELSQDKVVSDSSLDQARTTKDGLQVEVQERSKMVDAAEEALRRLNTIGEVPARGQVTNSNDPVQAAIDVQVAKLQQTEAELSPIVLTAPIGGTVSMVYHQSGETIMAGEAILTISAPQSDRIVGYLRSPVPLDLGVGMTVQVRSRSIRREVRPAKILQIGSQMEVITTPLLRPGISFEMGLPILINLPAGMHLRPGELVDLTLQ